MKNFRTYWLAIEFYKHCNALALPRHLKDQLNRASSSVSLNLAEGAGKFSKKDTKRFYEIAFGSLRESQAILQLAEKTNSKAFESADHLAASLYRLIKATI
jgi:four helix bundle protein